MCTSSGGASTPPTAEEQERVRFTHAAGRAPTDADYEYVPDDDALAGKPKQGVQYYKRDNRGYVYRRQLPTNLGTQQAGLQIGYEQSNF